MLQQQRALVNHQMDMNLTIELKQQIVDIVKETCRTEITVESKNEAQLLDILRLRDNEVIKAREQVAEKVGLLEASEKVSSCLEELAFLSSTGNFF